jgi:dienelactone hydrolase
MPSRINFVAGTETHAGFMLPGTAAGTLLVLPDWRGWQTDYALRRGQELQRSFGCSVVVSDLYGTDYRPKTYDGDAERWISRALADPLALRGRLTAYITSLAGAVVTKPSQITVIGYCLGGALAFEMGRTDCGLAAVASVHGIPSTKIPIRRMQHPTRFLAIHGASDPIIGMDHLNAFQSEMTSAGVDWTSLVLGHARHGFTNEELDPNGAWQRYDQRAARRCQAALHCFFGNEDLS